MSTARSMENMNVPESSHVSIISLAFPELPFSLLWSSSICNPIAKISAALCFLDIVLFWRRIYPHHSFAYHNIFISFIAHFADTKLFHYVPISSNDGFETLYLLSPLVVFFRVLALLAAIPGGLRKDVEAAVTLSYTSEHQLRTILWLVYLGGGFALWIGGSLFLAFV
jgi:hypothetical protein